VRVRECVRESDGSRKDEKVGWKRRIDGWTEGRGDPKYTIYNMINADGIVGWLV
jgi:hypothetical protein